MVCATVKHPPGTESLCLDKPQLISNDRHAPGKRDTVPLQSNELQTIWKWNKTVPCSIEQCIDKLFEERTQAHPMAPAVCAWDGNFTYGELDEISTRLCQKLVQMGVGKDSIVPLCFEKSKWMTAAMMAVIKTGATFVTLDPAYPERRLSEIVKQVSAKTIISSTRYEALGLRLVDTVVSLSEKTLTMKNGDDNLGSPIGIARSTPSSILYIVFTSGSTGTPKGVLTEHRNVASAVYHQADRLGINESSRFFDFSSYSYDVSISNILAILIQGGCVCTPSDEDRLGNIPGSIKTLNANITAITPSIARLLDPESVPGLLRIILVGEPVRASDISRWKAPSHAICRYGVSEASAASTIRDSFTPADQPSNIGTAAGLVTWIVDPNDHEKLCPLGAIGELLLEGPSLSRAYLKNPEKTATAYINDPEWLMSGAYDYTGRPGRLYKTGDLVRYAKDGSIIYVGRKDNQVKVNGQRVELGEIEHHIQECLPDEYQQVLVELITLPGENSRPKLVAFIQQRPN
ncbi:hypothetical protein N7456_007330 [Penicillium angulare]|uniref:AMP-dependent synthetase/ligase domain-containing protein n=1 Tax=Penicillium angulare TaxID=116970 RepID=A0A9W9FAI5_9EURO|nr:hypothetical protein N7456_007330 [Penicillium angulare]